MLGLRASRNAPTRCLIWDWKIAQDSASEKYSNPGAFLALRPAILFGRSQITSPTLPRTLPVTALGMWITI